MIVSALLSRAIRAFCLSGIALGMTAAVAQETTVTLERMGNGWTENLVVCSDPEGEITNGMDPPVATYNFPETEVGNGMDPPIEINNFPEGEISNGTNPPHANP